MAYTEISTPCFRVLTCAFILPALWGEVNPARALSNKTLIFPAQGVGVGVGVGVAVGEALFSVANVRQMARFSRTMLINTESAG